MANCVYRCENEWLPLDREEDHDEIVDASIEYYPMPMVFSTFFVPCPNCNIEAMNNLEEYAN